MVLLEESPIREHQRQHTPQPACLQMLNPRQGWPVWDSQLSSWLIKFLSARPGWRITLGQHRNAGLLDSAALRLGEAKTFRQSLNLQQLLLGVAWTCPRNSRRKHPERSHLPAGPIGRLEVLTFFLFLRSQKELREKQTEMVKTVTAAENAINKLQLNTVSIEVSPPRRK